jgi:hypothetical protein
MLGTMPVSTFIEVRRGGEGEGGIEETEYIREP